MRPIITLAALAAAAIPLVPAAAQTMHGYTAATTRLYSGPLRDYPSVRTLRGGTMVNVLGCLRDWTWCDVTYRGNRGWIAGSALRIRHDGRRRGIGSNMGIGVTTFAFGSYWDDHYRGQRFYGRRQQWQSQSDNAYRPEWGEREQRRNEGTDRDRGMSRDRGQSEGPHGEDHRNDNRKGEDDRRRTHEDDARQRHTVKPQSMAEPYRMPDHGTAASQPAPLKPWYNPGTYYEIPGGTRPVQNPVRGDAAGQPQS